MTRLRMLLAALLPLVLALLALPAAWPAAAADNLIVGAIYVGSVNDYGYNRSMHDGLMAMKAAIPATSSFSDSTLRPRVRAPGSL